MSKSLDNFFNGGLHKGHITELAGEAGSGKTQLALHFSVTSQISDEFKTQRIVKLEPKLELQANISGPKNTEISPNDTVPKMESVSTATTPVYKSNKVVYICAPHTNQKLLHKRLTEITENLIKNFTKMGKIHEKLCKIISVDNVLFYKIDDLSYWVG